jgi:NDP-sugar pyrophosphorylase family protein
MINNYCNIPIVILSGGKGERFVSKENIPKQFAKVSNNPIIIEIIKYYYSFGFNFFLLPLGYKKKFFIDFFNNKKNIKKYNLNILKFNYKNIINNKINLLIFDAGTNSNKLTRINRAINFIPKTSSIFGVSYGDIFANINFSRMINRLKKDNLDCILGGYNEHSPFGHLSLKNNKVVTFLEKPRLEKPINIGFYFFKSKFFSRQNFKSNYDLEDGLLVKLSKKGSLGCYIHKGFHFTVNNQKDLITIKNLYKKNKNLFKNLT